MQRYDISSEAELVERALLLDDGNAYLNRRELTAAAEELRNSVPDISEFRFSDSVRSRRCQVRYR